MDTHKHGNEEKLHIENAYLWLRVNLLYEKNLLTLKKSSLLN